MAALTVGTTAVEVEGVQGARAVLQNLGPGDVEIVEADDQAFGTGLQLVTGAAYELPFPATKPLWLVSDAADNDVRLLVV